MIKCCYFRLKLEITKLCFILLLKVVLNSENGPQILDGTVLSLAQGWDHSSAKVPTQRLAAGSCDKIKRVLFENNFCTRPGAVLAHPVLSPVVQLVFQHRLIFRRKSLDSSERIVLMH